jgi:hypothetical protein
MEAAYYMAELRTELQMEFEILKISTTPEEERRLMNSVSIRQ